MIVKKLEKVDEDIFQKKCSDFQIGIPELKELFHFIA
jgi:hypothetical protein